MKTKVILNRPIELSDDESSELAKSVRILVTILVMTVIFFITAAVIYKSSLIDEVWFQGCWLLSTIILLISTSIWCISFYKKLDRLLTKHGYANNNKTDNTTSSQDVTKSF